MRRLALLPLVSLAVLLPATAATAAPGPAFSLTATPLPANFTPGGQGEVMLIATDVGAAPTSGATTLEATLPPSLTPLKASFFVTGVIGEAPCAIAAQTVSCQSAAAIPPGRIMLGSIVASVSASPGPATIAATVSGGGAEEKSATVSPPIQAAPLPFGFLEPGLRAPLGEEDGVDATLAGSHPYQQTVSFAFPTESGGESAGGVSFLTNAGHPHETVVHLPAGLLGDPAATPLLCTELQLQSRACPAGSQIGVFDLTTIFAEVGLNTVDSSPLYNMVPPPGAPAELATDVASVGIFIHLLASLRSEGDYGIDIATPDILALGTQPIFGVSAQVWGDPSASAHDATRGSCLRVGGSCPPEKAEPTAFLTLPGSCPGAPLTTSIEADDWEQIGHFERSGYESAGALAGCNQLKYSPTLSAQPTTNLADSPSGLDVELHQPQDFDKAHSATAELRNATVTLAPGLVANPSQADGLAACSEEQIGYLAADEEAGVHFSKQPQSCPDAAKLGTLEVASPLLARTEAEGARIAHDSETGLPIPRPLEGSVYLAKPYENPFGSLLAIYLAVEDEQSGIVAKLAGEVIPDPNTGQLTTVFEENPQLPLEDVALHLFGGARAPLITPVSCGAHTTTSTLTPWSSPEGLDAHPESSFQTTAEPGGGRCPASEGAASNSPAFQAGTLAPQAGAYSPFVLKLSREDGTQRIAGIDTTLPPGLSGKLAGIGQCSEAQIAQAKAREKPNEGILEKNNPSCPSSSEVGTVEVSAGAGPIPFHTSGHAYLAGPYKGAPLSLAVIVPAVAGPFDLGAVVSRVALYVDPDTAQIHAVSDPLPQILEGIPLDVRSIALTMGRPQFTLNPTSCDPMSITASALSALGQNAALSNPFQVGGCPQLPFKPKLSLKLKGGTKRTGHPKLIANLKAKPGEANVASAQVKLPPSAFLDQAHIRTVCTRVQFAANSCPSGSIYGTATAVTPLLSDPLTGNVYLRSSSHKLPDLVVALKGPPSLPIEIDLDGKTDSVKGALRNTFEAVPDAPVSSFHLELFGGKKGLVVNSRNLCAHPYKAEVNLSGQNGKVFDTEPVVGTDCKRAGRKRHHGKHR